MYNLPLITKLVLEYINLEKGALIDRWQDKIRITDEVFISRRALKHFVERRKEELQKSHSRDQMMYVIFFAINHLSEVVAYFDSQDIGDNENIIYKKDYSHFGMPILRVVTQNMNNDRQDIVSIYYSKSKKLK